MDGDVRRINTSPWKCVLNIDRGSNVALPLGMLLEILQCNPSLGIYQHLTYLTCNVEFSPTLSKNIK
jgi:hypothetical protein